MFKCIYSLVHSVSIWQQVKISLPIVYLPLIFNNFKLNIFIMTFIVKNLKNSVQPFERLLKKQLHKRSLSMNVILVIIWQGQCKMTVVKFLNDWTECFEFLTDYFQGQFIKNTVGCLFVANKKEFLMSLIFLAIDEFLTKNKIIKQIKCKISLKRIFFKRICF